MMKLLLPGLLPQICVLWLRSKCHSLCSSAYDQCSICSLFFQNYVDAFSQITGKQEKNTAQAQHWKWVSMKQSGFRPDTRSGMSATIMAGSDHAFCFGGVYDQVRLASRTFLKNKLDSKCIFVRVSIVWVYYNSINNKIYNIQSSNPLIKMK